jgi:hypothetical protein
VNPTLIGIIVFACAFGGALAGMRLSAALPEPHRNEGSKDTVKIGIGLVATMTALVLGLVTASAKSSFDAVDHAIRQAAGNVLALDRALARYGPDAAPLRQALKVALESRIEATWPSGERRGSLNPWEAADKIEQLASQIRSLAPKSDEQRWLQTRALDLGESLLEVRFQVFGSLGSSVPLPFLMVLVFWLTVTFASFGLFAPRNPTVVSALFVCALSVGAAVFLVLEMDGPFDGLIQVSPRPLMFAISHLNR